MSLNEASSPVSPQLASPNLSLGKRIRIRKRSSLSISQEASLPSIPSFADETDWVSPFTLPPVSTLKGRAVTEKLSVHDRAGSSAYYAAAWGSPYALPSRSQSPDPRPCRNQSLDLSATLGTRRIGLSGSPPAHTRQSSLPSVDSFVTADPINTSSSQRPSSYRPHWLSESDGHDTSSDDGQLHTLTPSKNKSTRRPLTRLLPPAARAHCTKGSPSTITLDTFNGLSTVAEDIVQSESMNAAKINSLSSMEEESLVKDKPLPDVPMNQSGQRERPQLQTRPTLPLPVQSYQRPKRKIQVKGKTCIIAIPFTDRKEAGLPPLLTMEERLRSRQKWTDEGYPVDGFDVGAWCHTDRHRGAESRPTYPNTADLIAEHKIEGASVRLPDPHDWQAWVDYLREEKLRALGVTPSTSDAPTSTASPFSSAMNTSRVSSAYPGMAPSPPVSATSTKSSHARMQTMSFSPLMAGPGNVGYSSALSARGTPQSGARPIHGYTQSVAVSGMTGRTASPYGTAGRQPNIVTGNVRSPIEPYGDKRVYTPGHVQYMHSMVHNGSPASLVPEGIHTPTHAQIALGTPSFSSPIATNLSQRGFTSRHVQNMQSMAYTPSHPLTGPQHYFGNIPTSSAQFDAIRRQQKSISQQQYRAPMDHQRQMPMFPLQQAAALPLPETPKAVSPARSQPEILHPTPRSHRHNLSAALEYGVTEQITVPSKELIRSVSLKESDPNSMGDGATSSKASGTLPQQDQEPADEDPPILMRPETLKGIDEEKEEIITNPSVAGTPLLDDVRYPFISAQPITATSDHKNHAAELFLSSLNVQAKEFNPTGVVPGNAVNFSENPVLSHTEMAYKPRSAHKSRVSSLGLNVAAQPFVPATGIASLIANGSTPRSSISNHSTPLQTFDPRSSTFSFTSTSFNVDAPEFKPTGQFSSLLFTPSSKDALKETSNFEDLLVDSASKPVRRGTQNKPLAATKSTSRDVMPSTVTNDSPESFGADGRATAPADRQKRARMLDNGGQDDIVFAESAPFKTLADESTSDSPMSELGKKEEVVIEAVHKHGKPVGAGPVAGATADKTTQATETFARELLRRDPQSSGAVHHSSFLPKASQGTEGHDTLLVEQNTDRTATAELNHHDVRIVTTSVLDPTPELPTRGQPTLVSLEESLQRHDAPAHLPVEEQISMSAAPCALTPNASESVPIQTASNQVTSSLATTSGKESKKTGLMASRFAATPSPPNMTEPSSASPERANTSNHIQETVLETVEKPHPTETVNFDIPEGASREIATGFINASGTKVISLDEYADHDRSSSVVSKMDEMSYEELNAIIKQMEDDPDGGIIREGTPVEPTPLIDMRLRNNFRSDAPSPSPRRLGHPFEKSRSRQFPGLGLDMSGVHQLGYNDSVEMSDWGADLSPGQQEKLDSRAHYFDYRVNDLIDSVLESRLAPLEQSLQSIRQSIERTTGSLRVGDRRSRSSEQAGSEADDEDEYDAYEGYLDYRSRSPAKYKNRQDKIRTIVAEAMVESQKAMLSHFHDGQQRALEEFHSLKQLLPSQTSASSTTVQATLEDLRALIKQQVSESTGVGWALIETSNVSESRGSYQADGTSLDEVNERVRALLKENQELRELDDERQNLRRENSALEETLDEYRGYRTQAKEELDQERKRIEQLTRTLQQVREQYQDQSDSKDVLREQITNLQQRISKVMADVHNDENEWLQREQHLLSKNQVLQALLEQETHRRSTLESEVDKLYQERAELLVLRAKNDHAQEEISKMAAVVGDLQAKTKTYEDAAHEAQRGLVYERENHEHKSAFKIQTLQDELDTSRQTIRDLQSDADARVIRLQNELNGAAADLQAQKVKHDRALEHAHEVHKESLAAAYSKYTTELDEKLARHEDRLLELKEQHARDLQRAAEEKHQGEQRLVHRVELAQDKVEHLTSKISSLEEQLDVTKSAARAAVQAATSKNFTTLGVLTPASSVIASPPQRSSMSNASASAPTARGSELPEKISPQALRETILVLQEQLQHRESEIDRLETDLASVDREAPRLVKERDAETAMLRELLDVRLSDLQELIDACEQSDFDRISVKDAAIRLRTSIQMDAQLKERGLNPTTSSANSLTSSLANLTQSPRQMVAAAAWGNWRRVRDSGVGSAISDAVTGTPSRSSSTPSSFLTGIMTPPPSMRTPPRQDTERSASSSRSIAPNTVRRTNTMSGLSSGGARPLRTMNSQPRTLSSARKTSDAAAHREKLRSSSVIHHRTGSSSSKTLSPSTPRQIRNDVDFGDDVDDDASLLDERESRNPTGEKVVATHRKNRGAEQSRHTSSPAKAKMANLFNSRLDGGSHDGASEDGDDIVEVIEED